jgi:probable rRNA maturation factor
MERGTVVSVAIRTRRFRVNRAALAAVCARALREDGHGGAELSLAIVGDREMRRLNREYHGVDEPTDVLAFPLAGPGGAPLLGEVIVSAETAAREAARRGLPFAREVALYAVHGTLHLLGYDDHAPRDRRRMRRRERALLGSAASAARWGRARAPVPVPAPAPGARRKARP